MFIEKRVSGRQASSARGRIVAALGLILAGGAFAGPAQAQELTYRFINPSFGGNPFYSEHLLGIANIHRPDAPEEPATPVPTEEELLARQLQARFLSQLSSTIRERIEGARPGESGEFEFGDQRISFTRTATETRVTFVNTRTGETRVIVIPVQPSGGSGFAGGASAAGAPAGSLSAEQALGASGSSLAAPPTTGLAPPPL